MGILGRGLPTTLYDTYTKSEVNNRPTGFKNHIINPAFEVNQHADIDTAPVAMVNNTYQIDRFVNSLITVTGTIQRLTSQTVNGKLVDTIKTIATSTSIGAIGLTQKTEIFYNGETKTFGAWVRSNSVDARAYLYDGVSSYSSTDHSGSGLWEFLSFSNTIIVGATTLWLQVRIASATNGNTTITTGDYIESTMWQLEDGTVATPFEQRTYDLEKFLCGVPTANTFGYIPRYDLATADEINKLSGITSNIQTQINSISPIGVGQTWQNVTVSRSIGTIYTNSTSKAIMVSASLESSNSGIIQLKVAGVITAQLQVTGALEGNLSVIVPVGNTYQLLTTSGSHVLRQFAELR